MIDYEQLAKVTRLANDEEQRIEAATRTMGFGRAIQICQFLWARHLASQGLPTERPDAERAVPWPTEKMLDAAQKGWRGTRGKHLRIRLGEALSAAFHAAEPATNKWREAVMEAVKAQGIDAPITATPRELVARLIKEDVHV